MRHQQQPAAGPDAAPGADSAPAAAPDAAPAATCPYGFGGGGNEPRMSVLHCTLCKGLLYDAHKIDGCRHIFCKECLGRFRDCPVCGADIEGTTPAEESQGEPALAAMPGHAVLGTWGPADAVRL
jgi:hypothetical protein